VFAIGGKKKKKKKTPRKGRKKKREKPSTRGGLVLGQREGEKLRPIRGGEGPKIIKKVATLKMYIPKKKKKKGGGESHPFHVLLRRKNELR